MTKILVVEDEEGLREIISDTLEIYDYEVLLADNGKKAIEIIETHPNIHLVLSDFSMPEMDGLQLFKWLKNCYPMVKFVLMSGMSKIDSTQSALDLGMDGYINKPFDDEEIIDTLEEALNSKMDKKIYDEEYSKVPINFIPEDYTLPFRVYVKINSQKFTKIIHSGENLTKDRLDKYIEQGLQCFYIKREDFKKLISFNLRKYKTVRTADDQILHKKTELLNQLNEELLRFVFIDGLDKESIYLAKDIISEIFKRELDNEDINTIVENITNCGDELYFHSIAVSLFSVMVAQKIGKFSQDEIETLALGSFFHDIGKCDAYNLFSNNIDKHEIYSYEILSKIDSVHSDVKNIVLNHHDFLGTSRKAKKEEAWVELAHILCATNVFVRLLQSSSKDEGVNETVKKIIHRHPDINPEVAQALQELLPPRLEKKVS